MDQLVGEDLEGNQTPGSFLIKGRSQIRDVSWATYQVSYSGGWGQSAIVWVT